MTELILHEHGYIPDPFHSWDLRDLDHTNLTDRGGLWHASYEGNFALNIDNTAAKFDGSNYI